MGQCVTGGSWDRVALNRHAHTCIESERDRQRAGKSMTGRKRSLPRMEEVFFVLGVIVLPLELKLYTNFIMV